MTWGEFFTLVALYAPIGTAIIAFGAACVAIYAVIIQRDIARRRAAVDFFLKTEMDHTVIDLYTEFKKIAPTIKNFSPIEKFVGTHGDEKVVRPFLNICELIAVGVNQGAFSDRVSYDYWGDVIPKSYRRAEPLIVYLRTSDEGSDETYADLEKLSIVWETRAINQRAKKKGLVKR